MSKSKAVQLLQTGEIVVVFWTMLALRRLVLTGPVTMPDTCDIGNLQIEWLVTPHFEPERMSSKTAFLSIPLHSHHYVEMEITIGAVSGDWIPRKIEWRELSSDHSGSFSFADTMETIMVCDLCGHEFYPFAPEQEANSDIPTRCGCRFCPR